MIKLKLNRPLANIFTKYFQMNYMLINSFMNLKTYLVKMFCVVKCIFDHRAYIFRIVI